MTEIDMGVDEHPAGSIEANDRSLAVTHSIQILSPAALARFFNRSASKLPQVPLTITLQNEALRHVDVKAKDLTTEQQQQILEECRVNPAYFFHTTVRTPAR